MTLPPVEVNVQLAQAPETGEPWAAAAAAPWSAWLKAWLEKLPLDQQPHILAAAPRVITAEPSDRIAESDGFDPSNGFKGATWEVTVRFTDDAEIAALNGQYRQKPEPTDVLAFAALEADLAELLPEEAAMPLYLGDIVISVETAAQQALEQGHSLTIELAWLTSHGLLHLLGWDHPDAISLARMLDQQRSLLQAVGILLPQMVSGFPDELVPDLS